MAGVPSYTASECQRAVIALYTQGKSASGALSLRGKSASKIVALCMHKPGVPEGQRC